MDHYFLISLNNFIHIPVLTNQKYFVGTQKNRLNETVLWSTQQQILKLIDKKIITSLR